MGREMHTTTYEGLLGSLLENQTIEEIPLDYAALLIAKPHCRDLDCSYWLSRLDSLADEVLALTEPQGSKNSLLTSLRTILFEKYGFQGNEKDYYNPENSFLNRVLETGYGIPISLSLLMIEVGRRVGLELHGIGLPCHFVVGYEDDSGMRYFDPFYHGIERTEKECRAYVNHLTQGSIHLNHSDFQPVTKRLFLSRLLNNLRCIYRHRNNHQELYPVLDQLLRLNPGNSCLHLEMAETLNQLGNPWGAYSHILTALEMDRRESGGAYQNQIREMQSRLAVLN